MANRGTVWRDLAFAVLFAGTGIGCGESSRDVAPDGSSAGAAGSAGDSGGAGAAGAGGADAGDPPGCVGVWSPIESAVLAPRSNHSTVWTGSEILVFGGAALASGTGVWPPPELADGARFNPSTNALASLPSIGTPRQGALAVFRDGELIVFGGFQQLNLNGPYPVLDGFRLDAVSGAVSTIPEPPDASWLGQSALIGDVVLTSADTESWCRFSLTTSTWACESALDYFDVGPPGGWRHNDNSGFGGGELYNWGGSAEGSTNPTSTGFRYSPDTHAFIAMSTLGAPEPRFVPALAWLGDRMLVYAGFVESGVTLLTGGFYDPATDTWTALTPAPSASVLGTATRAGERVVFWNHGSSEGAVYDLASSTWTELCRENAMPAGNDGASATWTGSELVVLGGKASKARIGARLTLP
jgi:hypothetical protein